LDQSNLRFRDFGFEMQDSSNFKISILKVMSRRYQFSAKTNM
jgi:hypothetical protein